MIKKDEQDFKAKSIGDQVWLLYEAINKINEHGCNWASQQYGSWWKKLSVLGFSIGSGFGLIFIVAKIIHCF